MTDIGNPRFLALLEETAATHRAKAAGYAGSENPDTWSNFREATAWGLTPLEGCLVRMGDKYRRVQNLRRNAANDQVGESIRDTLMDLANYALIAVCLMEEEQEKAAEAAAEKAEAVWRCEWQPPCVQVATHQHGDKSYCNIHSVEVADQIRQLAEHAARHGG